MDLNEKADERPLSMPCPKCAADVSPGAKFCESCGAPLTPDAVPAASSAPAAENTPAPAARCRCGAAAEEVDAQGYCTACGVKRHAPAPARLALPRDHVEIVMTPAFAAVTDRGKRHANNQDDVALAWEEGERPAAVLVVCDGVSSAQEADRASALAAAAARDALLSAVRGGTFGEAAMASALRAGHEAAKTIPYRRDHETLGPPGATIVAAVVQDGTLTVGWVGDSRAYLFAGGEAGRLLTRDHSWVNEMVDAGEMTEAAALRSKQAHAITRCLGPLNGEPPDDVPVPSLVTLPAPPGGLLLVCSDGLWNYAAAPDELAALIKQPPDGDALALCRRLVDFALAEGGRDNITAAVVEM